MKKSSIFLLAGLFVLMLTGCEKEAKCPDTYELEGGVCIKEIDHDDAKEVLKCEEGYALVYPEDVHLAKCKADENIVEKAVFKIKIEK